MTSPFSRGEGGAGIDAGVSSPVIASGPGVVVRSSVAVEGAAIVVVEPSGRTTRFFRDVQPTQSSAGATPSVRDVLMHTKAAESASALYDACQEGLPRSARRPGSLAVIDASVPGQIRLLRDGWAFLYGSPRGDDDAWLVACAAFVEAGYALHDAVCLALAQVAAGAAYRRTTDPDSAEQENAVSPAYLASSVDARTATVPPLTAFPDVYAPWRIPGRPVEEGVAESPFDETAALSSSTVPFSDATSEIAVAAPVAGRAPAPVPSVPSSKSDARPDFPRCADALGLYPIAPSAAWVGRLIDAGARTVQLRIKTAIAPVTGSAREPAAEYVSDQAVEHAADQTAAQTPEQAALRDEIRRAVAYCRQAPHPVQLFINDHWQQAIEAGAYGVHLGQEDLAALPDFALDAIASAGLRLGLSTHGYYEMLLALRFRPSYIACGPIFATTTKAVAAPPQGLQRLAAYCRLLQDAAPTVPVVAIGGIGLGQLATVRTAGAASAAVVSALVNPANEMDRNALRQGVSALQAAFNG